MSITIKGKTTLGPNIVRDNLQFYIDMLNTKSYVSGSSTWYDLGPNSWHAKFYCNSASYVRTPDTYESLSTGKVALMAMNHLPGSGSLKVEFLNGSYSGTVYTVTSAVYNANGNCTVQLQGNPNLSSITNSTKVVVYSESIDPLDQGKSTGKVVPNAKYLDFQQAGWNTIQDKFFPNPSTGFQPLSSIGGQQQTVIIIGKDTLSLAFEHNGGLHFTQTQGTWYVMYSLEGHGWCDAQYMYIYPSSDISKISMRSVVFNRDGDEKTRFYYNGTSVGTLDKQAGTIFNNNAGITNDYSSNGRWHVFGSGKWQSVMWYNRGLTDIEISGIYEAFKRRLD